MLEITLGEYLEGESIWGQIQAIYPFPFLGEYTPTKLDSLLILNHGDKLIYYKIPAMGFELVAYDVVFNFKQKWLDLLAINELTLNIGADNTHNISETLTHAETRINTQDNINKVSAFNTDELIANDGSNSNNSDDIDYNKTRVLTDETLSLQSAFNNLNVKQKNNIIQTVNNDVASLLTLNIY